VVLTNRRKMNPLVKQVLLSGLVLSGADAGTVRGYFWHFATTMYNATTLQALMTGAGLDNAGSGGFAAVGAGANTGIPANSPS